jgi:UDP-N-acetylmuramoylalanine--D-glutamate ligase
MTTEWKNKNVLILGLGQFPKGSGVSAALYFAKHGARVHVTDQKTQEELTANVARLKKFKNVTFRLGAHHLDDIHQADLIVRNPRVRSTSPEMQLATKLGKRVESDVSLFLEMCPAKIVGITGTRGKSTTTTLVYEMLKASGKRVWLGGNILISPLTFVSRVKKDDLVVLELSSWLLETTGAVGRSPHISCVTNLMRDHLNSYSGMDEYAEAKAQIFRHQHPEDVCILNADDAYGKHWISEVPGAVLTFAEKKKTGVRAWTTKTSLVVKWEKGEHEIAKHSRLKILGKHNQTNLLAASLTALAAGAKLSAVKKVATTFQGLPDRQELLAHVKGVAFVNDTTATTPDGTIAALRALKDRYHTLRLIIGGSDKELDFTDLGKELRKAKTDVVLLPGTAHEKIVRSLEAARVRYQDVGDLEEALEELVARAQKGDVVLLSPGATSFGQFKNEFDRGNTFRKLVTKLDRQRKKR